MTEKEKKICTTSQTVCEDGDCGKFFPVGKFQETVEKRSLLLHSCCGPCSTAVVERLAEEDVYKRQSSLWSVPIQQR